MIFKLQQEVLKFNDICVGCRSPKIDLGPNYLSWKDYSFQNVTIFNVYVAI